MKNTFNYYNNMATISVAKALESISFSDSLIKYIRDRKDLWGTFGKKNSHLLRAKLFKMFEAAKLSHEEIFMIFFFFSVIKNRTRVKEAMENMEMADKNQKWYKKVYEFIDKKLVQYVSEEKNGKFAVVHLPTTMPGLDILCTVLTLDDSDEDFEMLIGKQTFAQLKLSADLQDTNKEKQRAFWENVVNKTRNPDSSAFKQGFVEEFYENSASDDYKLISLEGNEVMPEDMDMGYTRDEVRAWMTSILTHRKVNQ